MKIISVIPNNKTFWGCDNYEEKAKEASALMKKSIIETFSEVEIDSRLDPAIDFVFTDIADFKCYSHAYVMSGCLAGDLEALFAVEHRVLEELGIDAYGMPLMVF